MTHTDDPTPVHDEYRQVLAEQLEREIRPLLDKRDFEGGYNYDAILDHATRA